MLPNRLGALSVLALLSACRGGGGGITNDLGDKTTDEIIVDSGVPKMLVSDPDLDFGRVKIGGSGATEGGGSYFVKSLQMWWAHFRPASARVCDRRPLSRPKSQ